MFRSDLKTRSLIYIANTGQICHYILLVSLFGQYLALNNSLGADLTISNKNVVVTSLRLTFYR
jgi:hypothetical protein